MASSATPNEIIDLTDPPNSPSPPSPPPSASLPPPGEISAPKAETEAEAAMDVVAGANLDALAEYRRQAVRQLPSPISPNLFHRSGGVASGSTHSRTTPSVHNHNVGNASAVDESAQRPSSTHGQSPLAFQQGNASANMHLRPTSAQLRELAGRLEVTAHGLASSSQSPANTPNAGGHLRPDVLKHQMEKMAMAGRQLAPSTSAPSSQRPEPGPVLSPNVLPLTNASRTRTQTHPQHQQHTAIQGVPYSSQQSAFWPMQVGYPPVSPPYPPPHHVPAAPSASLPHHQTQYIGQQQAQHAGQLVRYPDARQQPVRPTAPQHSSACAPTYAPHQQQAFSQTHAHPRQQHPQQQQQQQQSQAPQHSLLPASYPNRHASSVPPTTASSTNGPAPSSSPYQAFVASSSASTLATVPSSSSQQSLASQHTRSSSSHQTATLGTPAQPTPAQAHVQSITTPLRDAMVAHFDTTLNAVRSALAAAFTDQWARALEILHAEVARGRAQFDAAAAQRDHALARCRQTAARARALEGEREVAKAAAAQLREDLAAARREGARAREAEERAVKALGEATDHNRILVSGTRTILEENARLKAALGARAQGQAGAEPPQGEPPKPAAYPTELLETFKKTVTAEMELKVASVLKEAQKDRAARLAAESKAANLASLLNALRATTEQHMADGPSSTSAAEGAGAAETSADPPASTNIVTDTAVGSSSKTPVPDPSQAKEAGALRSPSTTSPVHDTGGPAPSISLDLPDIIDLTSSPPEFNWFALGKALEAQDGPTAVRPKIEPEDDAAVLDLIGHRPSRSPSGSPPPRKRKRTEDGEEASGSSRTLTPSVAAPAWTAIAEEEEEEEEKPGRASPVGEDELMSDASSAYVSEGQVVETGIMSSPVLRGRPADALMWDLSVKNEEDLEMDQLGEDDSADPPTQSSPPLPQARLASSHPQPQPQATSQPPSPQPDHQARSKLTTPQPTSPAQSQSAGPQPDPPVQSQLPVAGPIPDLFPQLQSRGSGPQSERPAHTQQDGTHTEPKQEANELSIIPRGIKLSIAHIPILYHTQNKTMFCRMCMNLHEQVPDVVVAKFPQNASWSALMEHCEKEHWEVCTKLAEIPKHELAKMTLDLNARSGT
ncbi:hypothetical protein PUNSTDRAFT_138691 [Punctularia strigosozonata HHB-11173 SS5]|uniref:Uncharacterized protein n=1 Tax=Punctularia strigosozonata (strain HHB-11173) TaxID=741275 RepID=R7S4V2_PUNST|nr:uncharacterized protein PUNSTDRAFT_138691 [Punctularia strigosozonata HHB-11173 SS5]EIN04296.1 hypothetical protein PUNSTDRAFT_138691 [Punctularia strigosozonata HHB-11173 SS5]